MLAAGQLADARAGDDDTQAMLQQQHKHMTEDRHAAVQVGATQMSPACYDGHMSASNLSYRALAFAHVKGLGIGWCDTPGVCVVWNQHA